MINNPFSIFNNKTPIIPTKKNKPLASNGIILTGTTLLASATATGATILKHKSITRGKLEAFTREKIVEAVKKSKQGEYLYKYFGCPLDLLEDIKNSRNYVKKLERLKIIGKLSLDDQQRLCDIKMRLNNFDTFIANVEYAFHKLQKPFLQDNINKAIKNCMKGALAGLAVGLSIIGIKYYFDKNSTNNVNTDQ